MPFAVVPEDPPEEPSQFVSTRNESYYTRRCLVWQRAALPEDDLGENARAHMELMPSTVPMQAARGNLFPRKKRVANARIGSAARAARAADLFGETDDSARPPEMHRAGLRLLSTTRKLLHDETYMRPSHEEAHVGRSGKPRQETQLWSWQTRPCFDLRHEEHADVRSPLQIKQDAAREEERRRQRAFRKHLQLEAMHRAANRIPLRKAPPPSPREESSPERTPAAMRPKPPPLPSPLPTHSIITSSPRRPATARRPQPPPPAPPARDGAGSADGTTERKSSRPPRAMSARVRDRIQELADKFLTPRNTPARAGSEHGSTPRRE